MSTGGDNTVGGENEINSTHEFALIAQTQAESVQAWNRADLDGHLAVYGETVITVTPDGPRGGVACIREAFLAAFFKDGAEPPRLRIEQMSIRRLGANFALMTARYVLQADGSADQSGWTTLVWEHTSVGWRVIHDHTS